MQHYVLGQTLFKIVERLGITNHVGYVTCDNTTNNGTMLIEFSRQMARVAKIKWDPMERRINCLAHVINIVTQKLISSYSKSLIIRTSLTPMFLKPMISRVMRLGSSVFCFL
ncbi:hypothetical protein B0H14DRAFT_3502892 [Mycena olivaceomarginata]|nr:hypothetical protein B0H14DRAFT_3502892 [Mycena olivaceomarginata]